MTAVDGLIDRDEERARLAWLLDVNRQGPRALLLEGEAGIGKTSIWRVGVAEAEQRGYRVLAARPSEAERELSFAALGDLLGGVADQIAELPEMQSRGLGVALLLVPATGEPPGQRLLGMATLTLLRRLAEHRPLAVALDDTQWLDPPSAAVLSFALRRLTTEPVAILAAHRVGHSDALELEGAERLVVRSLTLETIDRMLQAHLGTQFLRPTLLKIVGTSGGNPFYALELGRALLLRRDPLDPADPLPVPENLRELVRSRLDQLSSSTREALLAIAMIARPNEETVSSAVEGTDWVSESLAQGVLERSGTAVAFTHPLLPSVLYTETSVEARRRMHARLAGVVEDLEERARHLAAAANGPDEAAAAALDLAAAHAHRRGATEAAGELVASALRLTPSEEVDAAHRRLVAAAHLFNFSGSYGRAQELLEHALPLYPSGPGRAELLVELGEAQSSVDGSAYPRLLNEALQEIGGDDDHLRTRIHLELAGVDAWSFRKDTAHVEAARTLAERLGDPRLLASALTWEAWHALYSRGEPDDEVVRRAVALQDETGEVWSGDAYFFAALQLAMTDRLEEAKEAFERYLELASRAGLYAAAALALARLCGVAACAGRWDEAADRLAQYQEIVIQAGDELWEAWGLGGEAVFQLRRGQVEAARSTAERAREATERGRLPIGVLLNDDVLGRIALASGDAAEAHHRFGGCIAELDIPLEPNGLLVQNDAEALIELGRCDEAESLLDRLGAHSKASPTARAASTRCRGLIASARGESEEALDLLQEAISDLEQLPRPEELGRTLLALGCVSRRQRKKRLARASLARALELFEQLEMPLMIEKTRRELAQVGGRASSPGTLTETERRIAELVASGRSNAQVARTLYVSPKTVEWNLSKIYRKLHVASRTELAAKLARSHN
jgi:DNA-binding NarL/FixJ family response regulator